MDTHRPKPGAFSREEYERAYDAIAQFRETGQTDVRCLRCGVGTFIVNLKGNSSESRCSTPDCVWERIRGI